MAVKVFISYSDNTPEPVFPGDKVPLFRQLYDVLEARNFTPLLDKDIETGKHWRDELFGRLAECHAAVVLVNQRALSSPTWVDTEVKILCWRAHMDRRNFRLIMVPYDGITYKEIAEQRGWDAVAPAEFQMLARDGLNTDDFAAVSSVLDRIIEVLGDVSDLDDDELGVGWLVTKICVLLGDNDVSVQRIARQLNIPFTPTTSPYRIRLDIARFLYGKGPIALGELMQVAGKRLSQQDYIELLALLSTYWVDPTASAVLLKANRLTDACLPFGLRCCGYKFATDIYIQQICNMDYPWIIIDADVKCGDASQIMAQIHQALHATLLHEKQEVSVDELNTQIQILTGEMHAPVFLRLWIDVDDPQLWEQIHSTYKLLRIILCYNQEFGSIPQCIDPLLPEYHPDAENDTRNACHAVNALIRPGRNTCPTNTLISPVTTSP